MLSRIILVCFFLEFAFCEHSDHVHTNMVPKVKIVKYNGPLNKHILSLFKGAEELVMIDCNVTSAPAHLYSHLPNLKKLYLENNIYQDVHYEDVMQGAVNLEEFDFLHNNLERVEMKTMRDLPKLKIFRIRGLRNPHNKILKEHDIGTTPLEVLDFSDNEVEEIQDNAFKSYTKLVDLKLKDNKIKKINGKIFEPLVNLEKLDLSGNQIEEFDAEILTKLPKLVSLNLSKNPLKSLDLKAVQKAAPQLRKLSVLNTEIPKDVLDNPTEKFVFEIIH